LKGSTLSSENWRARVNGLFPLLAVLRVVQTFILAA